MKGPLSIRRIYLSPSEYLVSYIAPVHIDAIQQCVDGGYQEWLE